MTVQSNVSSSAASSELGWRLDVPENEGEKITCYESDQSNPLSMPFQTGETFAAESTPWLDLWVSTCFKRI
jgi:hypothetical protein